MDEEFKFQATEEELAEFPEQEGTEKQEEESCKGSKDTSQKEVEKRKYTFTIRLKITKIVCYQQKWPI